MNKICDINFSKYFGMCGKTTEDLFFLMSDVNKIASFGELLRSYKICNLSKTVSVYYYFNPSSNLWVEEKNDDSLHYRICEFVVSILDRDKRLVTEVFDALEEKDLKRSEREDIEEDKGKFNKHFAKVYKEHQKASFAKSILKFFNHHATDDLFQSKININNVHLLPLKDCNLNLATLRPQVRCSQNHFTQCIDMKGNSFYGENSIENLMDSPEYKIVDKFFLDVCTGSEAKRAYLQKILGYFLTGDVPNGRTFYIFYGMGANGKSAVMDIMSEIMGYFCKTCPTSIILKRAKRGEGQPSPEIAVLDYGNRLGVLSETDEGEQLNEDLIKRISGFDRIDYRPLYEGVKEFRCESKLVMITNNKPFFNLSQSMVDRIRYVEFKSRFVQCTEEESKTLPQGQYKINTGLIEKLKTQYKDYVLLWCALGAKKFI